MRTRGGVGPWYSETVPIMRKLIAVIALLAACGGDSSNGTPLVQPDRLVIVSGDHQVAQIGTSEVPGGVEGILPDTLIARVEGDTSGGSGITGPVSVQFPAGTSVEYRVPVVGCGAPLLSTAIPDSAGEVSTLWEVPAEALPADHLQWQNLGGSEIWAADCGMEVRLNAGNTFDVDTTFTAYFKPGPASTIELDNGPHLVFLGGSRALDSLVVSIGDEYGNALPLEWLVWSGTGVAITDRTFAPSIEGSGVAVASLDAAEEAVALEAVRRIEPGWQLEWRCLGGYPRGETEPVDSFIRMATVDAVTYTGNRAGDGWWTVSVQATMSGGMWYADGSTDGVFTDAAFNWAVRQRPGEVQVPREEYTHTASDNPPTEYLGNTVCEGADSGVERFGPPPG